MDIDIAALGQAVAMLKTAIDAVKGVTRKLPEGDQKTEAETSLEQAERQLKLAEVQIANSLQYALCRNHFPLESCFPQIIEYGNAQSVVMK